MNCGVRASALVALVTLGCAQQGGGVLVLDVDKASDVGAVHQLRLQLEGKVKLAPESAAAAEILPTSLAVDLTDHAGGTILLIIEGLGKEGEVRGRVELSAELAPGNVDLRAVLQRVDGADAGPSDAGPDDSGPEDAGPADAGPEDGGAQDSGPGDSGPQDSGPRDSGPADSGPRDSGPLDAGSFDAGGACTPFPCGTGAVCAVTGCESVQVSISSPNASTLSGTVTIGATVLGGPAPLSVEFSATRGTTDLPLGASVQAPYRVTFSSDSMSDGPATFHAIAQYPTGESVAGTRVYTLDNNGPTVAATVRYPLGKTTFYRDEASDALVELAVSDVSGVTSVQAGVDSATETLVYLPFTQRYRFFFRPQDPAWTDTDEDGTMAVTVAWLATDGAGMVSRGSALVNVTRIRWSVRVPTNAATTDGVSELSLTPAAIFARGGASLARFDPSGTRVASSDSTTPLAAVFALGMRESNNFAVLGNAGIAGVIGLFDGRSASEVIGCSSPFYFSPAKLIAASPPRGTNFARSFFVGYSQSSTPTPTTGGFLAIYSINANLPTSGTCSPVESQSTVGPRGDHGVANASTIFFLVSNAANLSLTKRDYRADGSGFQNVAGNFTRILTVDVNAPVPRFPMAIRTEASTDSILVAVYLNDVKNTRLRMIKGDNSTDVGADAPLSTPAPACDDLLVGQRNAANGKTFVYLGCGSYVRRATITTAGAISFDPESQFKIDLSAAPRGRMALGTGRAAGILYVPDGSKLAAYDADSGARLWGVGLGAVLTARILIGCDGRVVAGDAAGNLWSIASDSKGLLDSRWPAYRHDNAGTGNAAEPIWGVSGGTGAVCY